jgi:restriction system protein
MPIPTLQQLLRPVLSFAAREKITRRSAASEMIRQFELTPEEASERLPSGHSTFIRNRTGWAMTFLTKAGLIEKVLPKTYQATENGRAWLIRHPDSFTETDLRTIPGYQEAWASASEQNQKKRAEKNAGNTNSENEENTTSTPEEIIERELKKKRDLLRVRLLKAILDQTPEFFEKLVLDVLKAMGYGSEIKHLGRSHDEGIDGIINQDALGLDQIMVQAKRYQPDNSIGRPTIQAFMGALTGHGVNKGVFITTSYFADTATGFIQRGSATKVVLVDGEKLIDLMIQHRIGVHVAQTYDVHELDQNYFDEDEE